VTVFTFVFIVINFNDKWHIFDGYKPLLLARDNNNTVVTWTAIIQAHCTCGKAQEALQLFQEMQEAGVVPNEYTYSCILGAVADLVSLHEGQHIHTQLLVIYKLGYAIHQFFTIVTGEIQGPT
jgi:pentatricopeptide repeat protein